MFSKVVLSRGEILAIKRFRSDNDGRVIKGVLARLLDHTRLENEENEANEEHRLRVKVTKEMMQILFEAELITEVTDV